MVQISLRAARINSGLELEEVAEKCNRSVSTIKKYERDSDKIPLNLKTRLINLYHVPQDYLCLDGDRTI